MEKITSSILKDWTMLNQDKFAHNCITQIEVKHQDHKLEIYTLYFTLSLSKEKVRIKALKNPFTKLQSITRYLQQVFGVKVKDTWKIIDMT